MNPEEKFQSQPEADISYILEKHGIKPCEDDYQLILNRGSKPFFLTKNGSLIPHKSSTLKSSKTKEETIKIGNIVARCEAITVEEYGEKRGTGLYLQLIKGGNGGRYFSAGSKYWPKEDGISLIDFLLRL